MRWICGCGRWTKRRARARRRWRARGRAGSRRVSARMRRWPAPWSWRRRRRRGPSGRPGWGWARRWPVIAWAPPRARSSLIEEARAADPNDPALLILSVSNHLEAGNWTKARLCLDHHAELSKDRDWGATLAGFGAHLAEHHEGDDEAAAARYRRLLEARPGDPVALVALERIASRTGDAPAQVRLAEAAVDRSSDVGERAALAMRAAELAETAAHDLPRAAGLARRALEAVPGYAPAAHVLERLYATLGQWGELVKVVEVGASAGAGERSPSGASGAAREAARETSARFERVGALYEERLQDPGKALALYGEWAELGERRPAALRALLRAAEKAGDALVAAEAALKLGTEIPDLPADARFAWCYRAAVIYEERAAADDEAVRAYEAALALDPELAPRAGRAGPRALPGPAARGAGHGAAEAGGLRAEPGGRQRAGRRGGPHLRAPPRPRRRGAGGDRARAVPGSGERRRHRRARPPAGAHRARRGAGGSAGQPGTGARRSDRQGGGVSAAGGDRRMAAGRQARGAGRDRARGSRDERRTPLGRRRDPHRVAAALSAGRARRGAGGGGARPADRRPARRPTSGARWISPGVSAIPRGPGGRCARPSTSRPATARCSTRPSRWRRSSGAIAIARWRWRSWRHPAATR